MSRTVFTYTDIRDIRKSPFFSEINTCPQITVTTDLRKGINWYPKNHKGERLFDRLVHDFGEVFEKIDPEWNSTTEVFSETVTISEYFRNIIAETSDEQKIKYYRGFKRNCAQIVRVINMLEEACVTSEDIRAAADGNLDVVTFCDAWDYLYEENQVLYQFKRTLERLNTKREVDNLLHTLYGDFTEKKLVIHGFYYISSLQERIFRIFENAGYQLIFLIPYHPYYPIAMETWDAAYSSVWGFDAPKKWRMSGAPIYNVAGEFLEGRIPDLSRISLKATKFNSVMEFAQAMKREKQGGEIYSSNATLANQILREIYPEQYGERRLLSYPVGQFLVSLHSMWDEEKATIILNEQLLKECFASGWIDIDGVSSSEYLRDLDLILPYFVDCTSYDEWEIRIEHLKQVYEISVQPFYQNIDHVENIRIAETTGNPFSKFGMFAVEQSRLYDILGIIERLISVAKSLFEGNSKTSISSHMTKLEKLISDEIHLLNKTENEVLVVNELMEAISRLKRKQLKCHVDDIVAAMHIYLNRADDDEDHVAKRLVGMVYPILQIDAAPIKHGRKVHICLSDMINMPGTIRSFDWPMNTATIDRCIANTKNTLLALNAQNYRLAADYNRYYFFSACNNAEVEFSWIDTLNSKRNSPSPYLSILESYGLKYQSPQKETINSDIVSNVEAASPMFDLPFVVYNQDDIKDMKMEYALCPLRYLYGYILDSYPKFVNTFQIGRAVGGLITALSIIMKNNGYDKKIVANQVFELFPQLRKIEKKQIYDYLGTISSCGSLPDEYEGYEFTAERFNISYPDSELLDNVRQKYSELGSQLARQGINLYEPTDVKKACMFCPHETYCRNCIHAVDQEEYYG